MDFFFLIQVVVVRFLLRINADFFWLAYSRSTGKLCLRWIIDFQPHFLWVLNVYFDQCYNLSSIRICSLHQDSNISIRFWLISSFRLLSNFCFSQIISNKTQSVSKTTINSLLSHPIKHKTNTHPGLQPKTLRAKIDEQPKSAKVFGVLAIFPTLFDVLLVGFLSTLVTITNFQISMSELFFNTDFGYLEALVRGFKTGLLTSTDYANLVQCETLEGNNLFVSNLMHFLLFRFETAHSVYRLWQLFGQRTRQHHCPSY